MSTARTPFGHHLFTGARGGLRPGLWFRNRDVGEKFPNKLYFYTLSKSPSEPVAWLETIWLQAALWLFFLFPFPDACGLQAC